MKTILQFKSINSFTTARLLAEKVTEHDLEKFRLMHTNDDVMRTLGGMRNEEQTLDNLNWNLKQWVDNGFGLWMFYLKDTREWVGRAGLRRVDVGGHEEIEVGYAVMPKFWNQGLATEMTQACLEVAFEVVRLDDTVSFTLTTNKASQRIMEKAGFQYERDIIHADLPHVLYRMKNPRKVEVVPYDTHWPDFFRQEANCIQKVLGSHLKEIHHIGSTAIPNMAAKPVIDMILECDDLDEIDLIIEKLATLNYYNIRRQIIPHLSFFTRRQDKDMSFNLHIHERGSPQIKRHVNFRDYVIQRPEDAKTYEALKIKLAEKFFDDMNSYVFGKDKLVQEIDTKAKRWPKRKNDYFPPNTGPTIKQWSHEKLVKAMVANLNVHMTHFSQYLNQVELIRIPGFTIVNSGLPDDTFNYILDADFSAAESKKKILEVTNYFFQKNIPFSWWVSPYDKPDDLPERLENAGLINAENNIGMYLDLDNWETPKQKINLEIVQVNSTVGLHDFASVLANDKAACEKYYSWIAEIVTSDDPIEFYVGYVNGKAVTRGQLVCFAQVAGLHDVSTSVDERRKGYGTAIEQFLLNRAKQLGYHVAVLQASQEGLPLYLKQGFKECCVFKEFKLPNNEKSK